MSLPLHAELRHVGGYYRDAGQFWDKETAEECLLAASRAEPRSAYTKETCLCDIRCFLFEDTVGFPRGERKPTYWVKLVCSASRDDIITIYPVGEREAVAVKPRGRRPRY